MPGEDVFLGGYPGAWLRNNRGLGAYAVMAPDSGGADRDLDDAGRRHDDCVNA
jgi:hypothetical protein